jgi:hypothetical protein
MTETERKSYRAEHNAAFAATQTMIGKRGNRDWTPAEAGGYARLILLLTTLEARLQQGK